MQFEPFFKQYIGEFGPFQFICMLIVGLAAISDNDSITHNFIAGEQIHWCKVDQLAQVPHAHQKEIAIPYEVEDVDSAGDVNDDDVYSSCRQFNLNYDTYDYTDYYYWNRDAMTGNTTNVTAFQCSQWEYDYSQYASTYTSEWNMVCDNGWKVSFISTGLMIGVLVGSLAAGAMSDAVGRFLTNFVFLGIKVLGQIISIFSGNYAVFIVGRVLLGTGTQGSWLITYVLMMEMAGSKFRPVLGVIIFCFHSIGFSLVPVYAYYVRDHIYLQWVMTIPSILLFFAFALLPESPRWLLVRGNRTKSEAILRKMAAVNNRSWPEDIDFNSIEVTQEVEVKTQGAWGRFLRSGMLVGRLAIISFTWFTCSLMYYALSLNTGSLAGSIYLNTALMGLVEIPANILCYFTLSWRVTGRRITCGGGLLLAGLSLFISIPFIVNDMGNWATGMSLLGKSFVTLAFCGIYLYSSELLPTEVRNGGIGFASMFARVSGMIAPFIGGPLADLWLPGPAVVCGSCAFVCGILCFLLPETLGCATQETVEDAINFGKKKGKEQHKDQNGQHNGGYDSRKLFEDITYTNGVPNVDVKWDPVNLRYYTIPAAGNVEMVIEEKQNGGVNKQNGGVAKGYDNEAVIITPKLEHKKQPSGDFSGAAFDNVSLEDDSRL